MKQIKKRKLHDAQGHYITCEAEKGTKLDGSCFYPSVEFVDGKYYCGFHYPGNRMGKLSRGKIREAKGER